MNVHLDTNFLIRGLLAGTKESASLDRWIANGDIVSASSVAWCEFLCGPVNTGAVTTALIIIGSPIPFTADDSRRAAELFNAAGRRRGSLPDCMIAAVAIRVGASIATSNRTDFNRFVANGVVLATP